MKRTIYAAAVIAGLAGGAYAGTAAEQLGLDKTAAAQVVVAEVAPVPEPVTGKNSLVPQNHLTVPLFQAEIKNLIGIFDRISVVATVENADCTTTKAVIETRAKGFNLNKWSIAYGNIRTALTSAEIPSLVSLFDRLDVAPAANGIETVYQVTVEDRVCNLRPAVWTATYDAKLIHKQQPELTPAQKEARWKQMLNEGKLTRGEYDWLMGGLRDLARLEALALPADARKQAPAAAKSMAEAIKDLSKGGLHNCDFYNDQSSCQSAGGCHWSGSWDNSSGSCDELAQDCGWYNDQGSCQSAGCHWHEDFYSRGCD